eukprot:TRINITY_DN20633_c0_g2_i6.p1 TRINITY_DN20633_c0_g2~~TRINITY_DN20633_c0_g2_i6.p1  ORF type:complete len:101 (-),score=17.69 TRINITY_DN20633_c0_g2_i6:61-363(-)
MDEVWFSAFRRQFEKYDRDNSGELDKNELKLFCRELATELDVTEEQFAAVFQPSLSEFDMDESGQISFTELKLWMEEHILPSLCENMESIDEQYVAEQSN